MAWRRAGPARWPRALLLLLLLLSLSARVEAGGAAASCQARRTGDRVVAAVELRQILDAETRRLLQLGMRGRLRVEAAVVRRRLGLFEQTVGRATSEAELAAGPEGRGLLVNGRLQADAAAPILLEHIGARLGGEPAEPALVVRITIELRVVTVASLSKVTAWATDSSEEEASSSLLTRALLSAVADDLTRTVECSCSAVTAP